MAEGSRKLWLDWQRGLAVLCMVEWHTWDAWRADAAAGGPWHRALDLVGGFAAPSFLYMAGLSQLLADAALARKGATAGERRLRAVRRALWLLGVAYLFRVAEFVLGGAYRVPGGWQGIFKVDVLNVIAVSLLASALLAAGRGPRAQAALALAAAAAVAGLAPIVAGWDRPESRVLDYLYGEWPRALFHLFPWAAFLLVGAGLAPLARREPRPIVWIALGAAIFGAGWLGAHGPDVYAHQDFWRTSPAWVAMRLGPIVAASGALQLLPAAADRWLSFLRTMGRHSLLGYFVSVELPYGALSGPLHGRLGTVAGAAGIVAMIAVTWGASALADRWDARRAERRRRRAAAAPAA